MMTARGVSGLGTNLVEVLQEVKDTALNFVLRQTSVRRVASEGGNAEGRSCVPGCSE